jgi:hypothetical protein
VLVEALVRVVVIEVLGELVEEGKGVSLVVDQQPVDALFADATNEPFRVAVRSGCPGRDLTTSMPSEAETRCTRR